MCTFCRWRSCHALRAGKMHTELVYTLSFELFSGITNCRQCEWVKTDFENEWVTDGEDCIFKGTETQFGSKQNTFTRTMCFKSVGRAEESVAIKQILKIIIKK